VRRLHSHTLQRLLQLLCSLPVTIPAIANHHGELAFPLIEEASNGVPDAGRVAPVVLWGDEHEARIGGYLGRPALRVGVSVLTGRVDLGGDAGLIVEAEVPFGEVDERG